MKSNTIHFVAILLLPLLLTGCMLVNPSKRRPVDNISFNMELRPVEKSILIYFKETIPLKPLPETVWDNHGAFWDPKESNQIGFTQDYNYMSTPTGGTAVASGTRMVVPFGRYLTELTKLAARNSYKDVAVCYDTSCVDKTLSKRKFDILLSVGVEDFRVWETYMNKINYTSILEYSFNETGGSKISGTIYKTITDESLGSPLSTSYSFISKMKEVTNSYTEEAVYELFTKAEQQK